MNDSKRVLIVGGGVSGLAAALDLVRLGLSPTVVEKSDRLGGHAAQYTCKATKACVKCGACLVVDQVKQALAQPAIEILTDSRVENVVTGNRFQVTIASTVDTSSEANIHCSTDAVILAAGFKTFNPVSKPYGYGIFANVITNLELEQMLRHNGSPRRPSDNRPPRRIAFIQCVGSRDAQIGNLWCSKVCCASSIRLARLILMRRPETEITFFYIDVQSFSGACQHYYDIEATDLDMRRVIPGDVYRSGNDHLKITTYDTKDQESRDELYELVVLSTAITPGADNHLLADLFGVTLADSGFFTPESNGAEEGSGVFLAGTVKGPMNIAEAVASGSQAAVNAAAYLASKR